MPAKQFWKRLLAVAVVVSLPLYWLFMFVMTHLPVQRLPHTGVSNDKLAHMLAYFGLAFLLTQVILYFRSWKWRWLLVVFLLAATYGALDELTQPLVGRTADVKDWIADCLGAIAGVSIGTIFFFALRGLFHWVFPSTAESSV